MAEYPFFIIVFLALISLPILMILTSKIIRFILGKKKMFQIQFMNAENLALKLHGKEFLFHISKLL